jgi:hypothetical protein
MATNVTSDGYSFYMDDWLDGALRQSKEDMLKDDDMVLLVDGAERSGKSVFAMQMAKKLDPDFCLDRVCISSEQFIHALKTAGKGQAIVFDESFRGLSSQDSYSETNRLLVSLMMEMGQRNLIVIIVLPTFFMLRTYVAVFRSKCLFHVYRKNNERGQWAYFNNYSKKGLYIMGKKTLSYSGLKFPKYSHKGRFYDQYVVDEKAYRDKKMVEFNRSEAEESSKGERASRHLHERNILLKYIMEKEGYNYSDLQDMIALLGIKVVSPDALRVSIARTEKLFSERVEE